MAPWNLDGATRVQDAFSRKVCLVSLFSSTKASQMPGFVVHGDAGCEPSSALADAKPARLPVFLRDAPVFAVGDRGCISQVCDSIIASNAVDMVNVESRPFPMHIKPSKSMCGEYCEIDTYTDVPVSFAQAPNWAPTFRQMAAREYSGFRVVVQQFLKALLRKRGVYSAHLSFQ